MGVDGLTHVSDAIGAQDVEREGAQPGKDAGLAWDPAVVFPQNAVAHVMRPVLDAPVGPNRAAEVLGVQPQLTDVVRDLPAGPPQAGAGVLAPAKARDAGRTGDHLLPLRRKPAGHREDLDPTVLLASVAVPVEGLVLADRFLLGAQPHDGIMQARLVGLEPDQKGVAAARGARETFFGSAARRR